MQRITPAGFKDCDQLDPQPGQRGIFVRKHLWASALLHRDPAGGYEASRRIHHIEQLLDVLRERPARRNDLGHEEACSRTLTLLEKHARAVGDETILERIIEIAAKADEPKWAVTVLGDFRREKPEISPRFARTAVQHCGRFRQVLFAFDAALSIAIGTRSSG